MKSTKHTPGPWKYVQDEGGRYSFNSVVAADGTVVIRNGDYDEYNACTEADAKLIAAAPELLEAAKRCLAITDNGGGVYRALETAIAKAEGRL